MISWSCCSFPNEVVLIGNRLGRYEDVKGREEHTGWAPVVSYPSFLSPAMAKYTCKLCDIVSEWGFLRALSPAEQGTSCPENIASAYPILGAVVLWGNQP